ncbi:MAG: DUF2344 domain-containing protein [Clostridia bacterium]|nr:DUF2344 domain-containing protein [Clostridia bacterium]
MRNVRLIYKKSGRARYISHLDINRLFSRVLKRSGLPVWYTEGFNPHIFVTFALPLSLGFESEYDICDFRLDDESISNEKVLEVLKNAFPESIEVVNVIDPLMKVKELTFAEYNVKIDCDKQMAEKLKGVLNAEEIIVEKTTKHKKTQTFDVKPKIKRMNITETEDGILVNLLLPAGSIENINPTIIFEKVWESADFEISSVKRGKLYDKNMQLFH